MGKWIVCSAWPYVNSVPHLGTFIHLLSADVFSRYLQLKGEEVISVTGSDEHGTPIEVEAINKGVSPKSITDQYHNTIVKLLKEYEIRFSNYTRTENPVHTEIVQDIFQKIYQRGFIFQKNIELPYCENCSRYLPDRFIKGTCPYCNFEEAKGDQCDHCGKVLDPNDLIKPQCVFCGSKPTIRMAKHWFFDLSKFTNQIKKYLDNNPQLPENAKNFSYRWLEEGLKSRSVTRDNKWGIPAPFPGAEEKTVYVWLEAVLGYISATVEWARKCGKPDEWQKFWFDKTMRNVHFIGKDNIPFHTILFPALLMATGDGYTLPWQISSTEFILYESQKFSKSRKIGVWVDEALEIAEAEYWRYILIALRPESKDANFTWKEFSSKINGDLNDVLGNYIYRTLSFLKSKFNSKVPKIAKRDNFDNEMISMITKSPSNIEKLMEKFRIREALTEIIGLARKGNQYLSFKEPWKKFETDLQSAQSTVNICTQLVNSISILIFPFLPRITQKIRKQLNVSNDTFEWHDAGKLIIQPDHTIGSVKPLFQKFELKDLLSRIEEIRKEKSET